MRRMISKNEVACENLGWNKSKMQQTRALYDVWLQSFEVMLISPILFVKKK
jgi:hypothetical protein